MQPSSLLWKRLDAPGHDAARLFQMDNQWHIEGAAVFLHEQQPCKLDYQVICDADWRTRSGKVTGWVGNTSVDLHLEVHENQRWFMNTVEYPAVAGCIDFDLNFSPATNLISLRRLHLNTGEERQITVAWLKFPEFSLEPLPQLYRRMDATHYHYESPVHGYVATLEANEAGFVTHYPGLWISEQHG